MMVLPELVILDVGHGNCCIVRHGDAVAVIDAPHGAGVVLDALDSLGIKKINALLLSHSDEDHISGAIPLILDDSRPVESIYVNPDSTKKSQAFMELRMAIGAATRKPKAVKYQGAVGPIVIPIGDLNLHVIHPMPENALGGPGALDQNGNKMSPNSLSAVIRIDHRNERICVLAGDMDWLTLEHLKGDADNLHAPILVFPHHGGRPDRGDETLFAHSLTEAVSPEFVFISHGRRHHRNPRPNIIQGIRTSVSPYIACTQLSRHCAEDLPDGPHHHLSSMAAGGKANNECCSGTIVISIDGNKTCGGLRARLAAHSQFVQTKVSNGLCTRTLLL